MAKIAKVHQLLIADQNLLIIQRMETPPRIFQWSHCRGEKGTGRETIVPKVEACGEEMTKATGWPPVAWRAVSALDARASVYRKTPVANHLLPFVFMS